jgi:hypothetical protein
MIDRTKSATLAEYHRKAVFYRAHAQKAGTPMEREYWMRISNHWLEIANGAESDCDDQIN